MLLIQAIASASAAIWGWTLTPAAAADSIGYTSVGGVQFVAFLVGGITFLMWVYRATANAHGFGAQELNAGPGMAVGWYFIPIANLGMPFLTMRETWQASVEPKDWEIAPYPRAILWLWWLCFIVSNSVGLVAARLAFEAEFENTAWSHNLVAISDAITVPGALALAWIVGVVSRMQDERIAAMPVAEPVVTRPAVARID